MIQFDPRRFAARLRSALVLAVMIAAGLIAASSQPTSTGRASLPQASGPSLTSQPPPAPEPLVFAPIAPDTAREINAAIPFAPLGPAAARFAISGDAASQSRAVDCLAAAMWYEAGDDAPGERSVGQVVLNRVRHAAYPATVCGVVFEGSERATGCQFTFTCDGALARTPPAAAFDRARAIAASMLNGQTDASVGLATHYHTDWVHPIWSAQLEKIAQVRTHLFFRWKGAWGSPRGFARRYAGGEPVIARLAFLSPAHSGGNSADAPPLVEPGAAPTAASEGAGAPIRMEFSPVRNGNVQGLAALERCGEADRCEIIGVLGNGGPSAPVVFHYQRDRSRNFERVQWDCTRFKRPTTTQCMK